MARRGVQRAVGARTAWGGTVGRSKYRARPTVIHGFRFASQAEARRYQELMFFGRIGQIRNLELQPRFPLHVGGVRVGVYVADFRYEELVYTSCCDAEWRDVIEDVKGVRTPTYQLKKKMFEAEYGRTIQEVR